MSQCFIGINTKDSFVILFLILFNIFGLKRVDLGNISLLKTIAHL